MRVFSLGNAICLAFAIIKTSVTARRAICATELNAAALKSSYNFQSLSPATPPSDSGAPDVNGEPCIDAYSETRQSDESVEDSYDTSEEASRDIHATLSITSLKPKTFTKVTRLGVRVQGDKPKWNAEHQRFASAYFDSFDDNYRAAVDTVNIAAVEGALKYVQAECINASVVNSCERKNNVRHILFYQTTIVQPTAAMEYYVNATDERKYAIENCPFNPMDGGQCGPVKDGVFPSTCNQYIGANGEPDLGFCIGGTLLDEDPIAPYPHNYWFSYPNSCPEKLWSNKTEACRKKYAGGMCPFGKEPDGETCTFSYEILGYILLDDVVGITLMLNPATGKPYADYSEFCMAGGVEFNVAVKSSVVTFVDGLDFWKKPGDPKANSERIAKLMTAYEKQVSANCSTVDGGTMRKLPTIDELAALNPPCYENSPLCAASEFGCKRLFLSQICQLCTADESGCEKAKN